MEITKDEKTGIEYVDFEDVLNESINFNIEEAVTFIYYDLMVIIFYVSIDLIYDLFKQFNLLSSVSIINKNSLIMEKIKEDAVDKFNKDFIHINGKTIFEIVFLDFDNIDKFKDKNMLKNYLLRFIKNKEMIDYIKKELS